MKNVSAALPSIKWKDKWNHLEKRFHAGEIEKKRIAETVKVNVAQVIALKCKKKKSIDSFILSWDNDSRTSRTRHWSCDVCRGLSLQHVWMVSKVPKLVARCCIRKTAMLRYYNGSKNRQLPPWGTNDFSNGVTSSPSAMALPFQSSLNLCSEKLNS